MNPGVYTNKQISHDLYHADPCIVPSLAAGIADALINQSPAHAWTRHRKLNPNYIEKNDSKFDIGTAGHALLLEGIDRMHVCRFDDWRKSDARAMRDDARAQGLVPILAKHEPKVRAMVKAAATKFAACTDLAGYTMDAGMAEHTLIWKEDETWLRCRPDWMSPDRRIMLDAKFTDASANPEAYARMIVSMAYDLRASFYLRGNKATGGHESAVYLFLVQETEPPYATSIIGLPPAFVAMGDDKVERAIALWRRCMASGKWPGYPNRICYVEPPAWAMAQFEALPSIARMVELGGQA